MESEAIPEAKFALYLNDELTSYSGQSSNIVIGGHDLETYSDESDFEFVPLTDSHDGTKGGGWFIKLLEVEVGGEEVSGSSKAAIDSGTSLIVGPATAVEEIWSYMNKYVTCVKSKPDHNT